MIHHITIKTSKLHEMIDITAEIQNIITGSKINSGIALINVPHTTAAITINENADPDVKSDILLGLDSLNFDKLPFKHAEGNSSAHLKSSIIGFSLSLIIDNGYLLLGTWQGIYLCEFDGPRNRNVIVKILEDK